METTAIELHETMLRLAKGIVSARDRFQHRHSVDVVPPPIAAALRASPFAAVLDAPLEELKASLGVWEQSIRLARAQQPAG